MSCCQYNPQLSKFHFLIMFFERDLGLMNSPGNFCHLVLHVLVWMCRELNMKTVQLGKDSSLFEKVWMMVVTTGPFSDCTVQVLTHKSISSAF